MSPSWTRLIASEASERTPGLSNARCRSSSAGRRRGGFWSWPDQGPGKVSCQSCVRTGRPTETNAVVLVDTSVWIEVLRKTKPLDLQAHADLDDVVTCLPVVQEVLHGIDREEHFRVAREAMWAFPIVESPLTQDTIEEAIGLYRRARRAGITVRSSVDCLIAACALRHDLTVLHVDRDFTQLARISHLEERRITPPR